MNETQIQHRIIELLDLWSQVAKSNLLESHLKNVLLNDMSDEIAMCNMRLNFGEAQRNLQLASYSLSCDP